jgi:hypothetical protein
MKLTLILSFMFVACSMHAQTIKELQSEIVQLQKQVATLQANKALALAPFVSVDARSQNGVAGPNITFSGANIHIVDGMGQTQLINGLGNLIIGYDELTPTMTVMSRAGSHNVILGRYSAWISTAFSNLIAGEWNLATDEGGFVAGYQNVSEALETSVLGGTNNLTYTDHSVIIGGINNQTMTPYQIAP